MDGWMDDIQKLRNADMMIRRTRRRQGIGAERQVIASRSFEKQGKERKTFKNGIEEMRTACEARGRV